MKINDYKNSTNRDKINFGFTLVEMLVTLSIIVIMSSILIVYSRNGEKVGQLNRATERLSFDVRRMASMSMQTKQFKDSSGNLHDVCGWGIYFGDPGSNSYIIFSDFCETGQDKGNLMFEREETQETITFGKSVKIADSTIKSLVYVPPEPKLYLISQGSLQIDRGEIVLSGVGNNKTIEITNSGNFIIR